MPRKSYHEIISSTKAYCAHDDLIKNTQWNSLGRDGADVLNDRDGTPAILTIIGEIVNDKLIVGPLGNFQSQEDKFKSDNKMTCDQAKLVVVIRSPSRSDHPNWAGDYEGATKNLKDIQETVAKSKPNAPRQYFLDFKTGNVPTTRFTHILWEKKVSLQKSNTARLTAYSFSSQSTQDENEEYDSDPQPKDDLDPSDDELMNSIQSKAVDRGAFSYRDRQTLFLTSFQLKPRLSTGLPFLQKSKRSSRRPHRTTTLNSLNSSASKMASTSRSHQRSIEPALRTRW